MANVRAAMNILLLALLGISSLCDVRGFPVSPLTNRVLENPCNRSSRPSSQGQADFQFLPLHEQLLSAVGVLSRFIRHCGSTKQAYISYNFLTEAQCSALVDRLQPHLDNCTTQQPNVSGVELYRRHHRTLSEVYVKLQQVQNQLTDIEREALVPSLSELGSDLKAILCSQDCVIRRLGSEPYAFDASSPSFIHYVLEPDSAGYRYYRDFTLILEAECYAQNMRMSYQSIWENL